MNDWKGTESDRAWDARCATVQQLIARDARWVAWLSSRSRAGLATGAPDGRGAGTRNQARVVAELAAALHDVRRRRLCLHRPEGWPVLTIEERARLTLLAARWKATNEGESVTVRRGDVQLLGFAVEALLEVLSIDWAEAVGVQERLVSGELVSEVEHVEQLERLTLARVLAETTKRAASAE